MFFLSLYYRCFYSSLKNGFGNIKPDSEAKPPAKVQTPLADAKQRASKRLLKARKDCRCLVHSKLI